MAWGAGQPLARKVTFSLHLVSKEQRLVSQVDQEMGAGRFPVTRWHTWLDNPVVAGEFPLLVPPGTPPGSYELLAGAFEPEPMATLMRPNGEAWVRLATVRVAP